MKLHNKKLPKLASGVYNDGFVIIGEKGKEIIEIVKKNKTQGYKLKVSFEDFFKFMERIKTE
jgi:hypothetical protein